MGAQLGVTSITSASLSFSLSELCLPRRIFCPVKVSGPVCVCDYQFIDEGLSEVIDRLKEMLDIQAADGDLDTRQEVTPEMIKSDVTAGGLKHIVFSVVRFVLQWNIHLMKMCVSRVTCGNC